VAVHGQWGSKIEALLRRLVWLRDSHPEVKALVRRRLPSHVSFCEVATLCMCMVNLMPAHAHAQVFSQWRDALLLVSKALDVQNPPLRHVSLTGVKRKGQARPHSLPFWPL
jgi:hypothetical protein